MMNNDMDVELRARMCAAEVAAAMEKYGMQVAITRIERLMPGQGIHVEFKFDFVPAPQKQSAN